MPAHKDITDPNVHEPKGISSASNGQVYVADGAGSGTWKEYLPHGWGLYHDSAIATVLGTSPTKLTINGSGADTDENHLPTEIRGTGSLWDTVNNKIDPIREADTYSISLDFDVTVASTASWLTFQLDQGGGTSPLDIVSAKILPLQGTPTYRLTVDFFIRVSPTFNTNGGQIFCKADAGTPEIDNLRLLINRHYDGDL